LVSVLRVLRPWQEGLLPPNENLPFLVTGDDDHVASYNLEHKARVMTETLLEDLLNESRVLQVHKQEGLLGPGQDALGVGEFLELAVSALLSAGLGAQDPREWHLQRKLVTNLRGLHEAQLPEEVAAHVLHQLRRVNAATLRAYGSRSGAPDLSAPPGSQALVVNHLELMRRDLSEVFCAPGQACSSPQVFMPALPSSPAARASAALFLVAAVPAFAFTRGLRP